jgi:hypothetical protein
MPSATSAELLGLIERLVGPLDGNTEGETVLTEGRIGVRSALVFAGGTDEADLEACASALGISLPEPWSDDA